MRSYNHPGTTELAKYSWAGTQTISSLVRKINFNVLNTWLAKQELPVRRSGPVRKIYIPDLQWVKYMRNRKKIRKSFKRFVLCEGRDL